MVIRGEIHPVAAAGKMTCTRAPLRVPGPGRVVTTEMAEMAGTQSLVAGAITTMAREKVDVGAGAGAVTVMEGVETGARVKGAGGACIGCCVFEGERRYSI